MAMASNNSPSFLCWLKGEINKKSQSFGESSQPSNDDKEDENSLIKCCSMLDKLTALISIQQHALNVLTNDGQMLDRQQINLLQEVNTGDLDEKQVIKLQMKLTVTQNQLEIIIHRLNLLSDTMEKTFELMECINKWQKYIRSLGDEVEESKKCNEIQTDIFNYVSDKTEHDYNKNEFDTTSHSESDKTENFIREINTTSFDNLKFLNSKLIGDGKNQISNIQTNQDILLSEFLNNDIMEVKNEYSLSENCSPRDKIIVSEIMSNNNESNFMTKTVISNKNESNTMHIRSEENSLVMTEALLNDMNKQEAEIFIEKFDNEIHSKDKVTTETQCVLEEVNSPIECSDSENSEDFCHIEKYQYDIKVECKDRIEVENVDISSINENVYSDIKNIYYIQVLGDSVDIEAGLRLTGYDENTSIL